MDIEYHYYVTCIIARRAGFSDEDAYKIAYACQYTDDNHTEYEVQYRGGTYQNYISQTEKIFKPREELMRIYPCFHFLPGTTEEIIKYSLPRKDGKLHLLNTIANNSNAEELMQLALNSENLYRIGIATHTFADTFAHQNFAGSKDSFNSMKGLLEILTPNIGHADARYAPDWPAHIWTDSRIIASLNKIDNKKRFLEASEHIFTLYRNHLDSSCSPDKVAHDKEELIADLDEAIGTHDKNDAGRKSRMERYRKLMGDISDYRKGMKGWFGAAVKRTLADEARGRYAYESKQDDFENTDWFKFQEAVKQQQEAALKILAPIFERTELTSTSIW